jgi:hypothetical protein
MIWGPRRGCSKSGKIYFDGKLCYRAFNRAIELRTEEISCISARFWEATLIWFIFLAAALAGMAVHLGRDKSPRTAARVVEIALWYLLVIFAGAGGLMGALGHTFRSREIALGIGWPPGSPFQFEVAMANLAFGVLGVMCIWHRGGFWTATGVGWAVFLLGCAYGHAREMLAGNFAPMNAGLMIWLSDVMIPLAILGLLLLRRRLAQD